MYKGFVILVKPMAVNIEAAAKQPYMKFFDGEKGLTM